jgi:hypothetical protein
MSDDTFYKQPTLTDVNPDDEPPSSIPHHIGPYKIESLLNKGGMSILYPARDPPDAGDQGPLPDFCHPS